MLFRANVNSSPSSLSDDSLSFYDVLDWQGNSLVYSCIPQKHPWCGRRRPFHVDSILRSLSDPDFRQSVLVAEASIAINTLVLRLKGEQTE